jgi:putative hydrolase of the HAD superfamily
MLHGVVFDFGGVVIAAPFARFAEVEQRYGLSPDLLRQVNARNPDSNAWAQFERGTIAVDEFVHRFEDEVRAAGGRVDGREIVQLLRGASLARDQANPAMLTAIDTCKGCGVRVALLTNNTAPLDTAPGAEWVFETFDVVIESSKVGLRKPDPEIYALVCAELGVAPERTAMLDDLGVNLKPARALGMHTIKVTDPDAAAAQLLELLGCRPTGE